ncbi:acetate/propionate family kinase [Lactiplantibacillus plantarum]|uniref:acetate/propionate family kinase n=1 Tax=Lactiplantibacillus plantarum TaxID=1590 RepID=UPI0015A3BE6D|nr:acetate kinase [Lactiplantibacillus plantarum]MBX4152668.1 acetate kinase [Lactiplantibacillus plantarum]MED7642371.1 acetate kinase [Lactiplantibacillus plantarum]NVO63772.1 acetate kinase [Lactiplantibacillus plantarum]QOF01499.1 acetate kinase [Lactiplantibacillus plantarum]UVO56325.1 acetate kinase [Lactiplantibacillus plantarum]
MGKTIAINAGSSTLKFKLFEMPQERVIAQGAVERIGFKTSPVNIRYGVDHHYQEKAVVADHLAAVNIVLDELIKLRIIDSYDEITGVGHRVVAGGEQFHDSVLITDQVLKQITDLAEYAPLHNPANAVGIRAFKRVLPHVPAVAVFDTAFHASMPAVNYLYSLPYDYYQRYGARKFGAHGTSHRYVAVRAAKLLGRPLETLKLITLHLGAGSSITAIDHGQSLDTSMGFTPLAGITMATRSGDVDPSLVAYLMKKLNISDPDEILTILNTQSGLLGLAGSADMQELEARYDEDSQAQLAIDIFVNRIVKYVGAYLAELQGADALVITAGIGERDARMRQRIADRLTYFGVAIDPTKNQVSGVERDLSTTDAKIRTLLIPTDEELMIASDVERVAQNQ